MHLCITCRNEYQLNLTHVLFIENSQNSLFLMMIEIQNAVIKCVQFDDKQK